MKFLFTLFFISFLLLNSGLLSQVKNVTEKTKADTTLANKFLQKAEKFRKEAKYDSSNYYFNNVSDFYKK